MGIGYGHASRCVNLARRLISMGNEVFLSSYGDGLRFLAREAIDLPVFRGGKKVVWKMKRDGSPDIKGTLMSLPVYTMSFMNHLREEVQNLEAINPDIVISDSRIATLMAASMLEIPSVVVLNQPKILLSKRRLLERALARLMGFAWRMSNTVLMADFPPPYTISRAHVDKLPRSLTNRLEFVGPLVEVRREKGESVRDLFDIPSDRKIVLVMISGPEKERKSLFDDIIRIIRKYDGREMFFLVSKGDSEEDPGISSRGESYIVFNWISNKWMFFNQADVIVSRGGHTVLSEALLLGIPVVSIPTPGHTEKIENSRSLERIGAGLLLEQSRINNLIEMLRRILEDESYRNNARKIRDKFSRWDSMDRAIGLTLSSLY